MRLDVARVTLLLFGVASCLIWAQSLTRNGTFANDGQGTAIPEGWSSERGAALYHGVNTDGLDDNCCLIYESEAAVPAGPVVQTIRCRPDTEYVLAAALKSDGTCQPEVCVFSPGRDAPVAHLSSRNPQWQRRTARFSSGTADELQVKIYGDGRIRSHATATAGMAAVDDVQLYPADAVPEALRHAPGFIPPGPNVARGRPVKLKPAPRYRYCTDPHDATQLTDGVRTVGYFWTQKTTVGWQKAVPVEITIDLGSVEPVAGVSYSTAAGVAGVTWPGTAFILTSEDGKRWRYEGDLVKLSMRHAVPPGQGYGEHRFATNDLRTRARFVKLMVSQFPYCFCDEVEVYRGSDNWLNEEPTSVFVDGVETFFAVRTTLTGINWRLRTDLKTAQEAADSADTLTAVERERLMARITALRGDIDAMPEVVSPDFTTVLPLNALHARVYALNAPLLRARGFGSLDLWKSNRWAPLLPTDAPVVPPTDTPTCEVRMMRGEIRADAINIVNPTDDAAEVGIRLGPFPASVPVSFRDVLFTDTASRKPVAAALPEAPRVGDGWTVTVPAGCSKQVWISVERPTAVGATYETVIQFSAGDWHRSVPLLIRIADVDFPTRPSMSMGGWDYTNGAASYYRAPGNLPSLQKLLREHYMDTPWATGTVQPKGGRYDDTGHLINPEGLDFTAWDEWVERWAGVRSYYVFLSVRNAFRDEPMGTPRFNIMVGDWITAWVEHMKERGLSGNQLGVLLVDEPHTPQQAATIVAWANAIRAAQPDMDIFEDPTWSDPAKGATAMLEACTTLCPNTPMMVRNGDAFRRFYEGQRADGRRLWLYSCSGPAKLLDPVTYHRGQMWWAMRVGATGSFYWALGCGGGIGNSWNAYAQTGIEYAPFFVGQTSVTRGKHMEAVREGIQDYEYFVMLRDVLQTADRRGIGHPAVAEARAWLDQAPVTVTRSIAENGFSWSEDVDHALVDESRVRALELLEGLTGLVQPPK